MRLPVLIVVCGLTIAESVDAQDRARPDSLAAKSTLGDPTASATRTVGSAVLASITSKDKLISGSVGTSRGSVDIGQWNPWLKGSGPVNEDDATAPTTLADLSGMRSTSKIAAGVNFLKWPWKSGTGERAVCRRVFANPPTAPDSITQVINQVVKAAPPNRQAAVRDSILDYLVTKRCSRHRIPPSEQKAFDNLVDYGKVYLAAISAEYGRTTFKYADTLTTSFTKQMTEPWSVSAGMGIYLPAWRMLFAGTLRYEHAYEGGTPRQYCIPVGNSAALQCRTLALSAPDTAAPVLLTAETRWFINEQAGISPRFTADLTGKKGVGFELPILVRQKTDQGFTSAVALGWRSKQSTPDADDRLYVSLIVGVTFGIGLKL